MRAGAKTTVSCSSEMFVSIYSIVHDVIQLLTPVETIIRPRWEWVMEGWRVGLKKFEIIDFNK